MLTFLTSILWDGNSSFHSVFWIVNLFSWVKRYPKFVHSRTFCWKHTCSFHSEEKSHRKEIPVLLKLLDTAFLKGSWKKKNLLDLHKRTLLSSGKRRKKSIYLLAFFVTAYERQLSFALNSWHAMIYGCNYCNIILGRGFPPVIK